MVVGWADSGKALRRTPSVYHGEGETSAVVTWLSSRSLIQTSYTEGKSETVTSQRSDISEVPVDLN